MQDLTEFTPLAALVGGMMIGVSAVLLMASSGRVAGISGQIYKVIAGDSGKGQRCDAILFTLGLILAAPLYMITTGAWPQQSVSDSLLLMGVAGALVGFGAAYGSGCTSGHGICGVARGSMRSILATITFMLAGILTVSLLRHFLGN